MYQRIRHQDTRKAAEEATTKLQLWHTANVQTVESLSLITEYVQIVVTTTKKTGCFHRRALSYESRR